MESRSETGVIGQPGPERVEQFRGPGAVNILNYSELRSDRADDFRWGEAYGSGDCS